MEASFLNFLLLVLSGLGVNWGSLDMIERMPSAFMDFCLFLLGSSPVGLSIGLESALILEDGVGVAAQRWVGSTGVCREGVEEGLSWSER